MAKLHLPLGSEYSLEQRSLQDIRLTFQLFSAHRRKVGPEWSYPEHTHPLFELLFVLEGEQETVLSGKKWVQKAGDLLLIRPGESHTSRTTSTKSMVYGAIHFDVDDLQLRQLLCQIKPAFHGIDSPLSAAAKPITDLLTAAKEEWDSVQEDSRRGKLRTMEAAFRMFATLCGLLEAPPEGWMEGSPAAIGLARHMADWIERQIAAHPDAKEAELGAVGVGEVARQLGYSTAYCNRVFKNVFGMSPRQYLSTLKLRQAKLLLLNRDLPVERVAEMVGYKDTAQFSKQFKRWMDMSPSQYRQLTL